MDAGSIVLLAVALASPLGPPRRPTSRPGEVESGISAAAAALAAPIEAGEAGGPGAREPAQRRKRRSQAPAARELEPFVADLDATLKAARERNAPVLILIVLEGEEASDRFRDQMLPAPELAAAAANALVMLANNGLHDIEKVEVEGVDGTTTQVQRCKAYRTPSCTDHQRAWDQAYAAFYPEQDMYTPAVIVVSPAGEVLKKISNRDVPSVDGIAAALEAAHAQAGPVVSAENVRAVKALLAPTRAEAAARHWVEAWQGWRAIAELAPGGVFAEQAQRGVDEARAGARATIDGLVARLVPGSAADAWQELDALARAAEGLEIERELKRIVAAAERQADIQDEIGARRVELEAREMWQEAQALLREGDVRRAERLVRRLLTHRRLRETEAAREAGAAHPEWVDDEG